MQITVKLFASFRVGRFLQANKEFPSGSRVADVVAALDIAAPDIGIVMLDSRMATADALLHDGAKLALFPLLGGG
ncbi:MAG TPA: MoaD/ThiS family protein [Telmatospirillum sp.]|nr:MoaD/ThiS family protein [Telmatospirillum sp.]